MDIRAFGSSLDLLSLEDELIGYLPSFTYEASPQLSEVPVREDNCGPGFYFDHCVLDSGPNLEELCHCKF